MPNYDYDCTECGHSFEAAVDYEMRNSVDCELCQSPATIVWRKSQKPVLFREDNYQIESGSREGVRCSSKRQLLDAIKYANDSNPNPVEVTSEYYG